jgi:hypothetical protein
MSNYYVITLPKFNYSPVNNLLSFVRLDASFIQAFRRKQVPITELD